MAGIAILTDEVRPDADLLGSGPSLPQSQVVDLSIGLGRFQSTFAKPPLDASRLQLLFEEVDLAGERLTLLIHSTVAIDLGHETPVVNGELVKLAVEGGVRGPTPSEGRNKPCGQCPGGVLVVVVVIHPWGVEVGDEGEIPWGVVFGIAGDPPPIHAFDPLGRTL